jgi:5-formyltetrahydrofolate cyclo-ligase
MAWLHAQYRPKLYAAGLAPDGEAAHFGYAPGDTLRPGKFGLPTPNGPSTSSLQFDVILIPALGFDDAGYRLGYGGGYYDRLLATQAQALRVGVCFELGHQQSLPHEPHDQVLHYMVTERSVYTYV